MCKLKAHSMSVSIYLHVCIYNLTPLMHTYDFPQSLRVAQFPQELITYGGNGAVFQNWAQFHVTLRLLARMNEKQTLR